MLVSALWEPHLWLIGLNVHETLHQITAMLHCDGLRAEDGD